MYSCSPGSPDSGLGSLCIEAEVLLVEADQILCPSDPHLIKLVLGFGVILCVNSSVLAAQLLQCIVNGYRMVGDFLFHRNELLLQIR